MNPKNYILALIFCCSQPLSAAEELSLEAVKNKAATQSKYLSKKEVVTSDGIPKADLAGFHQTIQPILEKSCVQCHGEKKQKADFRIDTLDPDLVNGKDADWWLEVIEVMSNSEMPPEDEDVDMTEEDRGKVVDWLSSQVLMASQVKRGQGDHSSFRRMTRYEFNYALQDLLGLAQDFSIDLPPETTSEDGFRNSSEMLQMTSQQFSIYREIAIKALNEATAQKEKTEPNYFSIKMDMAGKKYDKWVEDSIESVEANLKDCPELAIEGPKKFLGIQESLGKKTFSKTRGYFYNRVTGQGWNRSFPYGHSLWKASKQKPVDPVEQDLPYVMALPHKGSHKIDLGTSLPDHGKVKVRFRASRVSAEGDSYPSLRLSFGYKPSNNSSYEFDISKKDIAIKAAPGKAEYYEWIIPMEGVLRNPYLRTNRLGYKPNPSEYLGIKNVHQGEKSEDATVFIDYIEISTPFIEEWPSSSYRSVFPEASDSGDELSRARTVLEHFMTKAWRRSIESVEIEKRLTLFKAIRPTFDSFNEAMIEVLATVISSPNFLYLSTSNDAITDDELAARLSFFLWSSQPDDELQRIVSEGRLREPGVLVKQADRLLGEVKAERFSKNFTHQWLGMDLLDHLRLNKELFPSFSKELKRSMEREPIEFFRHVLNENSSVMDFIHSDYTLVNQSLARHYEIEGVFGNHFQKVDLPIEKKRGGLLTQAGLLAMNSDGKDSHPLKRGIWLLESILHDPPPPPPPAVPEIDLTDPNILKMTLKERMEDHRNDPACFSCHSKIDPWGVAFEEYDAFGKWRDTIGDKPVDATSKLYNKSELAGMDGLKRYLLENRQDQFVGAMVHKVASYALGRPMTFADHAELERITKELREQGDGLRTLIYLLVESELFKTP